MEIIWSESLLLEQLAEDFVYNLPVYGSKAYRQSRIS